MAQLPSGILSVPRGKLSSSVWIHPRTGVVYSPPPKHKDTRSVAQLEHRERMRFVAPVVRAMVKAVSKPVWGARIKNLTPYNFAMGITLAWYWRYYDSPWPWLLLSPEQNNNPLFVEGSSPSGPWSLSLWEQPPEYAGRNLQITVYLWEMNPYRAVLLYNGAWVEHASFPLAWAGDLRRRRLYIKNLVYYREATGLFIYVSEGVMAVGWQP